MIYAILEQIRSRDGGSAMVLCYDPSREVVTEEMGRRVAKALRDYAILDLKLFSTSLDHATLASPTSSHGISVEFTVVEVPEIPSS